MATLRETQGAIITLDGLPIGQDTDPMAFLLKYQGQSADYALKHGGYGIEERDNVIRGYMAYLNIKDRRGYGVDGWVVRSIENMQAVSLSNGGELCNDAYFTKRIAKPTLSAIREALNYTTGNLSIVNAELDAWVLLVATRFGIDPDTV